MNTITAPLQYNPANLKTNKGNMAIVGGVVSIVAIIVTIIIGTILAGSFTSVATSSGIQLSEEWNNSLTSTAQIGATSFTLAGLLPIAVVAAFKRLHAVFLKNMGVSFGDSYRGNCRHLHDPLTVKAASKRY